MTINVECPEGGRHELRFRTYKGRGDWRTVVAVATCRKCKLEVGPSAMGRLLNAAMQLTADDAQELASDLYFDRSFELDEHPHTWSDERIDDLRDYASTWRGETDG